MPPDFALVFEASATEKLLLLSWMNFPMTGMSTDNHCEHWNETSPFEEESLGGDFYCGR
jgi:hypothetical protein